MQVDYFRIFVIGELKNIYTGIVIDELIMDQIIKSIVKRKKFKKKMLILYIYLEEIKI